jgi:hypothetical protein
VKVLPETSKGQTESLRRQLPTQGWEVAEIEQPFEDEWWAAEFWFLESAWSPRGVRLYLTFLVDPMDGRHGIWSVHASRERPKERPIGENPLMGFGHGWQQELRCFLAGLNELRIESSQE